ncbi:MAG: DUF2141 domain-containing protein [Persicimonas sp.]
MRSSIRFFAFIAIAASPLAMQVQPGNAQPKGSSEGTLVVEVDGFRNSEGRARAGLFRSDDGFPLDVDEVDTKVEAPIEGKKARLKFTDVPHGTYSVVVYHDEDADGSLDKNWVGMPKEGAGIYKPVTSRLPPPDFEDCKFRFDKAKLEVNISLNYR